MAKPLKTDSLYDHDFFAWTMEQAKRFRERASSDDRSEIDWENVAEEIESLGRSQRSQIRSRLLVVLIHLLKWRYQPERRSRSWKGTLLEQRRRLEDELSDSPSLAGFPAIVLPREYDTARLKAAGETRLPEKTFPVDCPFTIEQVLDPEFYPEPT